MLVVKSWSCYASLLWLSPDMIQFLQVVWRQVTFLRTVLWDIKVKTPTSEGAAHECQCFQLMRSRLIRPIIDQNWDVSDFKSVWVIKSSWVHIIVKWLLCMKSLAYTSKGCTWIEVLPVPNAYTISQLIAINRAWQIIGLITLITDTLLMLSGVFWDPRRMYWWIW